MYHISGGWIRADLEGDQHAFDVDLLPEGGYAQNCNEGFKTICGLIATRLTPLRSGADLRAYFKRTKCEICETHVITRLDEESRKRHERDVKKYHGESWWPSENK